MPLALGLALAYFAIYAIVFLFGSAVASFVNVLVYRLPLGISPAGGRSFCPACKHSLSWRDLLPVAGWLLLHGHCRYCQAKISPRYPVVEGLGGVLAVLFSLVYGLTPQFLLTFGVAAILLAVALIDWDTMTIPNGLLLALLLPAALALLLFPHLSVVARLAGMVAVSAPMWLLAKLRDGAFGGGDIKLMAVCGFLLGWQQTLLACFVALLGGGGYAVWLLLSKRAQGDTQFAFGPFLAAGVLLALLAGQPLVSWYLSLLG
ncbi:MAG: prepilin peptidase [Angelakisella sp.]